MTAEIGMPAAVAGSAHVEPALTDERPTATAAGFAVLAKPWLALPFLTALSLLLFIVNLGGYPIYSKGEAREAVTVWNMLHGGGWILPLRAGVEIPSKPLMMHWMAALISLTAGGISEWTVRMPSALFACGGVLACYLYVRRLFSDTLGLVAALVMGTTFQYLQAATGARVDMTLAFFTEMALFEFILASEELTSRRMSLYCFIAAAILAKGPVGFVLPALVALVWLLLERRLDALSHLNLGRGAILVVVIAGGWYLAAILTGGTAFVRKQILAENVYTFLYNRELSGGHAHSFYYVELMLLAGFLPWTLFFADTLAQLFRDRHKLAARTRYMIVWCLVVLVFYNMAHSKRAVYLLALYPALSTLIGLYLSDLITGSSRTPGWIGPLYAATGIFWIIAGVGAILSLLILWLWPVGYSALLAWFGVLATEFTTNLRSAALNQMGLALAIPAGAGVLGFWTLRTRPTPAKMIGATAGGFSLAVLAANLFIVPATARTLTLSSFAARSTQLVGDRSVGYLGALNYDLAFYMRRNIPVVPRLDENAPAYLFSWEAPYRTLPQSIRQLWKVEAESGPTELDGRGRMVLIYRAARRPPRTLSSPSTPAGF